VLQAPERQRVTAYGLDRSVTSWVLRPETEADVLDCLDVARRKGLRVCPAGGRNSFGDVFLLADHVSVDCRGLDRIVRFDPEGGTIRVEAGASTTAVLGLVMPLGWQLRSVSGSPWNTIGGDLSGNVNGKDSWHAGTFGDQVVAFRIVLANGSIREVDRRSDPALFNAVIGGLGLVGIVTEVTLQLRPIPSPLVEERSRRVTGVAELIEHFLALDPARDDLSYAWVDAFPRGRAFGRAVCASAHFVAAEQGPSAEEFRERLQPPATIFGLDPERFWSVVRGTWRCLFAVGLHGALFRNLNRARYLKAILDGERVRVVSYADYQYPMTSVFPRWNRKFAPEGFNEIQALVSPERFETAFRAVVALYVRNDRAPEVCGVRRHKPDAYHLSLAGDGLSFGLAFPLAGLRPEGLARFRRELIETILAEGGKVQLAKFPYMGADLFRRMYPMADAFVRVKEAVDPDRVFWSEAAERLLG
jgi:decaprenylphospho-beta-D-ribofuranose 2-oxidase